MSWRIWRYVRWLICAAVGLWICFGVVQYEREYYLDHTLFHMLSDGCFVTGVLFTGIGALVWIANVGGFTAFGYAGHVIKRMWFPFRKKSEERLTYYEYVQIYGDKEKKSPSCLIFSGLLFIAAAAVFLLLYWQ